LRELTTYGDIPPPRTYLAGDVIQDYMFIVGGEVIADVNDIFALNLSSNQWSNIKVNGCEVPIRRFHSLSAIGTQLFMVAGCMKEYIQFK